MKLENSPWFLGRLNNVLTKVPPQVEKAKTAAKFWRDFALKWRYDLESSNKRVKEWEDWFAELPPHLKAKFRHQRPRQLRKRRGPDPDCVDCDGW